VTDPKAVDALCLDFLDKLPQASRPTYDPRAVTLGILHLGIGSFHRAHQAVSTHHAIAAGDDTWGICGVTQRSASMRDLLALQDYLYSVVERDKSSEILRVIGSVREVISAPDEPERLTEAFADPSFRMVTLTVTEQGYHCDSSGGLVVDEVMRQDLDGAAPATVVGRLVRGLEARRRVDAGPIAVMSCDNLPRNGDYLGGAVGQFVERLPGDTGASLASWIADNVSFPSSVVDRIVPKTQAEGFALVERTLGFRDAAAVVTEPYSQWVIEGRFPGGRPRWPGVVETADIEPYQNQKLRLLNATHSALAYLGSLGGFATISETMAQPGYREFGARLMNEDAAPTFQPHNELDLSAYSASVLERFDNPYLMHRCDQVAADGSKKLPIRLLPSAQLRLDAGAEPRWVCLAVAAWMRFLSGTDDEGRPLVVQDPMAQRLMEMACDTQGPGAIVERILDVREIFPLDLAENETFRRLVTVWLRRLVEHGAGATLEELK